MTIDLFLQLGAMPLFTAIFELKDRTKAIEDRTKAVEQKQAASVYRGVWREGTSYVPKNSVTHDGSMWMCNCATSARPGTDNSWQLCVKRGKDAR